MQDFLDNFKRASQEIISALENSIAQSQRYHETYSVENFPENANETKEEKLARFKEYATQSMTAYNEIGDEMRRINNPFCFFHDFSEMLQKYANETEKNVVIEQNKINQKLVELEQEVENNHVIIPNGLTIKTLSGLTFQVDYDAMMSIEMLKMNVREHVDVRVAEIKLNFNGRTLDDTLTVGDYSIQPNDTLYMVVRLRG